MSAAWRSLLAPLLVALSCAGPAGPAAAEAGTDATSAANGSAAGAIAAATEESDRWLELLDHGKFADSWTAAAVVLQEAMSQKEWVDGMASRQPKLGRLIMRERKAASYSRTLRGAPSGDYVTVTYLTKFEKAPLVEETLAVAKDAIGQWRVAGYDIVPAEVKTP